MPPSHAWQPLSVCHQPVELGGRVLAAQAKDPVFDSQQLLAFHFFHITLATYMHCQSLYVHDNLLSLFRHAQTYTFMLNMPLCC